MLAVTAPPALEKSTGDAWFRAALETMLDSVVMTTRADASQATSRSSVRICSGTPS